MHWFTDVITKRYAQFSGRARRKEFWMFTLFSFVISLVLGILDRLFGLDFENNGVSSGGVLETIFGLAVLIPSLAVAIRRLHDGGRSGWWILINLVPCIGWIWYIVLQAQEGNPGDNQYGPDPKAAERGAGFGGPAGPAEPGYPTV